MSAELGYKPNTFTVAPWQCLAIIFIEGFITIAAEILTIRQLIPVVGNSVVVTSLIIGIFLLFLAYGYKHGGFHQSQLQKILQRNFIIAALLFGIGLSYMFIFLFFKINATLNWHPLLFLTFYLLCITAPLVYFLGQTVPITMNLLKMRETVGELGGHVLHISTLGSFLGAVATSLLLMHFFGVALTVYINCLALMGLALLLAAGKNRIVLSVLFLLLGILFYHLNVNFERFNFVHTDQYANYAIHNPFFLEEHAMPGKLLDINLSASSFLTEDGHSFKYIEGIKKIISHDLQLKDAEILVLGAGGFTLSALDQNNIYTYVDIDPAISKVVEKHFLNKIRGAFIAEDARAYLLKNSKPYEAIVGDAYNSSLAIPSHLLTREYFALLNEHLTSNGTLILNIIAKPTMTDTYSKRIDATIRDVFPHCMSWPMQYHQDTANILYICPKQASAPEKMVYHDDKNPVTWDHFNSMTKR